MLFYYRRPSYDLARHNASSGGHPVVHSSHLDNKSDPRRLMQRASLCPNLSTARSTVVTFSVSFASPTVSSIIRTAPNVYRCSIPPEYATGNTTLSHAARCIGLPDVWTISHLNDIAVRALHADGCTGGNHCYHSIATVPSRDASVRYVLSEGLHGSFVKTYTPTMPCTRALTARALW